MADRNTPRRKLMRLLRKFGVEDVPAKRGSHRTLCRTTEDGRELRYTLPRHVANEVIPAGHIKPLRWLLELSADHGVTDKKFYGGT